MKRRFFLLAAPAIVAAPSLMRVSALAMPYVRYPPLPYTATELTMHLEEFAEKYLRPQMIVLAKRIDADIAAELAAKWWDDPLAQAGEMPA